MVTQATRNSKEVCGLSAFDPFALLILVAWAGGFFVFNHVVASTEVATVGKQSKGELVSKGVEKCMKRATEVRMLYQGSARDLIGHIEKIIGLGRIMIEYKEELGYGNFTKFLEERFPFNARTAQRWIKVSQAADKLSKTTLVSFLNSGATVNQLMTYEKNLMTNDGQNRDDTPPVESKKRVLPKPSEDDDEDEEPDPGFDAEGNYDAKEAMTSASSELESFCRYIMKEWKDKCPSDPWLVNKGLGHSAMSALQAALDTARLAKCKDLCPECHGNDECKICLGTGRIPRSEFNQLGLA